MSLKRILTLVVGGMIGLVVGRAQPPNLQPYSQIGWEQGTSTPSTCTVPGVFYNPSNGNLYVCTTTLSPQGQQGSLVLIGTAVATGTTLVQRNSLGEVIATNTVATGKTPVSTDDARLITITGSAGDLMTFSTTSSQTPSKANDDGTKIAIAAENLNVIGTAPGTQTVTPHCSGTCASTWGYKVVEYLADGTTATQASAEVTTSANATALDATHYNTIAYSCTSAGTTSWNAFRTTPVGPALKGTFRAVIPCATTSVNDVGGTGSNTDPPTANATGKIRVKSIVLYNSDNTVAGVLGGTGVGANFTVDASGNTYIPGLACDAGKVAPLSIDENGKIIKGTCAIP